MQPVLYFFPRKLATTMTPDADETEVPPDAILWRHHKLAWLDHLPKDTEVSSAL